MEKKIMLRHKEPKFFLLLVFLLLLAVGCTAPAAVTEDAATEATQVDEAVTEEPTAVETEANAETEEALEPVTITYLASQNWVLDTELELGKQLEAETGIHVDYQIIPSDQYFNVLQTKLEAGGEGIDIFGGQSGKTDIQLQLNVEKNAVPLTDEEWVSRMNPLSTEQISLDG